LLLSTRVLHGQNICSLNKVQRYCLVVGTCETDTKVDGIVRETNLIVDNNMDGTISIKDSNKLGEMHSVVDDTLPIKKPGSPCNKTGTIVVES
jgi:hypothetical protein